MGTFKGVSGMMLGPFTLLHEELLEAALRHEKASQWFAVRGYNEAWFQDKLQRLNPLGQAAFWDLLARGILELPEEAFLWESEDNV